MDWGSKLGLVVAAALSGAFMAFQGTLNSILGKTIGLLAATFSVQLVGAVTAGILLLCLGGAEFGKLASVPWYVWLGGPIGVAIIFGVAFSIPKLGVGMATTAIIGAQLLTAYLIDHFGLLGMDSIPFNFIKLGGIVMIVIGARILLN